MQKARSQANIASAYNFHLEIKTRVTQTTDKWLE